MICLTHPALRARPRPPRDERGSAAVEYVGLAVVVSMLMAAMASAVDSELGARLAKAVVEALISAVSSVGS